MSIETPEYPFQFFPEYELPDKVIHAARMVVKCKYAQTGFLGAALLVYEGGKTYQVVFEPIEEMDDWITRYRESSQRDGRGNFEVQQLDAIEVVAAHRRQLEALDVMLHELDPDNKVT